MYIAFFFHFFKIRHTYKNPQALKVNNMMQLINVHITVTKWLKIRKQRHTLLSLSYDVDNLVKHALFVRNLNLLWVHS